MDARKFREAIKAALAFVIAYAIALQYNWMNPYWAGFAVSMVAFPGFNTGMSMRKALFRLCGTIPGSIMGLVISAVAGQDRWLFVFLVSAWLVITTFLMIADKRHAYFYNVIGFTMVMVIIADPSSSSDAFNHALYRSIENILGIASYTLVSLLIWPLLDARRPEGLSIKIINAQQNLLSSIFSSIENNNTKSIKEPKTLLEDINQLQETIDVASYEDNKVHMNKEKWDSFYETSLLTVRSLNRIVVALNSFGGENIQRIILNSDEVISQINKRYELIKGYIEQVETSPLAKTIDLDIDRNYLNQLNSSDKIRYSLIINELRELEKYTKELVEVLHGKEHVILEQQKKLLHNRLIDSLYDLDLIKRALLPGVATFLGYLVWIFVNPPGGTMWFTLAGPSAMAISATPQMNSKDLIKGLGFFSFIILIVYVFVLPALSTFYWLGIVIFVMVFAVRYFLNGVIYLTASLAIMGMGITNPMSYDFAHMLESDFANVFVTGLVVWSAYLIQNTRPEKALIHQIHRFFKSCSFLLEHHSSTELNFLQRIKYKIAERSILTLPESVENWSKAIPSSLSQPHETTGLIIGLRRISMQLNLYMEETIQPEGDYQNFMVEFYKWKDEVLVLLNALGKLKKEEPQSLELLFKQKYRKVLDIINDNPVEQVAFYPVVASYLMLTKSIIEYSSYAKEVNWDKLKEERFS